jgi:superfamily II DNA helicase RecQ
VEQIDEDDKAAHEIPSDDSVYEKVLKEEFGHENFREGQLKAIKILLEEKRNTLVVLATGGGKSLCYQYASRFLPGLVLVVTPLISLMTDQLQKLPDFIPGAALNSQQQFSTRKDVVLAV